MFAASGSFRVGTKHLETSLSPTFLAARRQCSVVESWRSAGYAETMRFLETGFAWRELPNWAGFLVRFGFDWMRTTGRARRVCLLSMPADSAGAGLVALGCLRQRLAHRGANDLESHFERIVNLACDGAHSVKLRRKRERGIFRFDKVEGELLWLRKEASGNLRRVSVSRKSSVHWYFDGEPPVEACEGEAIGFGRLYAALPVCGGPLMEENLRFSDSSIVLVSRPAGEAGTRQIMESIRLRNGEDEASLASLLTINAWTPAKVSRVRFHNCRTNRIDRPGVDVSVAVADGDSAFLESLTKFRESDVIGVVHRTIERERLEDVGTRLADLQQWYNEAPCDITRAPWPAGLTIRLLKRKE